MEHVKIFLYIMILMVGTWSVFYSWQIYKLHAYSFLQPIVHFIIFYNLVIMIDLTAQYSCINLVGNCLLYQSTAYARIMGPLSSFFFILMTYSLIRVVFKLQGKTISLAVKKWLIAGFSIIAISYGVRIILSLQGKFYRWFPITQSTLLYISIVVVLVYLILLLKHGRKSHDKTLQKIISPFGVFYLFGFTVSILSIKIPEPVRTFVFMMIFLLFNLFPILWFKRYFLDINVMLIQMEMADLLWRRFVKNTIFPGESWR